jgi:hypothetical protein
VGFRAGLDWCGKSRPSHRDSIPDKQLPLPQTAYSPALSDCCDTESEFLHVSGMNCNVVVSVCVNIYADYSAFPQNNKLSHYVTRTGCDSVPCLSSTLVYVVGWLMNSGLERCERKWSWPMAIYRSDGWKQRQKGMSICGQRCEPGKSGIRSGIVTNCTAMTVVSSVKSIINLWKEKSGYDLEVRNLYP